MPPQKVLVCGAGVSGSILAFWLAKHDFHVVVVERSKAEQKVGQGIEIEEPALTVVRAMGLIEKLEERKTGEMGFELVDQGAQSYGIFEVGGISPTGALELMRGDLTEVLYKAANESPNVTFLFETTVQSLQQTQDKVTVDLKSRTSQTIKTEEFDFVVGADGVKSRTRQLTMPEEADCFKPVGAYVAYFSIPSAEIDWPYSRLCQFPNRRVMWIRPIGKQSKTTSVYLIHVNSDVPSLRHANARGDRVKQKQAFAELFTGLGWETPRVVSQMMESDNFYSDELVQVKLPRWHRHRVALLGDAAWAPSPFTGEGNQLAIIGAWVLAQEMARNRSTSAFEQYEERLRSYVENAQQIPLGGYAPYICVPQTAWGIWLFRIVYQFGARVSHFIDWTGIRATRPANTQGQNPFDLQIDDGKAKVA